MLKPALAVALFCSAAPPQAPDRVVLKSGRALIGHRVADDARGDSASAVVIDDVEIGVTRVPRTAVRSVFVDGRCIDLFPPDAPTDPGDEPETYLRWTPARGGKPGGLDTCSSRWLDPLSETTVFLVGVVHIADPEYFAELQKLLDACDLVLFEGVGRGEISDSDLASLDVMMRMQLALRGALGLGYQKDFVDYDREFWVNSDVDFAELRRALSERSAELPTDQPVVQRILKMALSMADGSAARRSPKLQYRMKNLMGPGLAQADAILQRPAFAGMRGAVIEHRNVAVMKDLERQLTGGPKGRWIAIFYGGGHLPDFAKRFKARGMVFQGAAWSHAWSIAAHEPADRLARHVMDPQVELERSAERAGEELAVHLEAARAGDGYGSRDDARFEGSDQLALLVELLATHDERLDGPLGGEGVFRAWPVRRLGAALFDDDATLRTAARAAVLEHLGGAIDATARMRHRFGIVGGAYDDLAAVGRLLTQIAIGGVRGLSTAGHEAVASILFRGTTVGGSDHGVSLRAADGTQLDLGYLARADGEVLVWALGTRGAAADLAGARRRLLEAASEALR